MYVHVSWDPDTFLGVDGLDEDVAIRPFIVQRENGATIFTVLLYALDSLGEDGRPGSFGWAELLQMFHFVLAIGARDMASCNSRALRFLLDYLEDLDGLDSEGEGDNIQVFVVQVLMVP